MNRSLVAFIFSFSLGFVSCGPNSGKSKAGDALVLQGAESQTDKPIDTACAVNVVKDMMHWYKQHYDRLISIQLVNSPTDTDFYKVNFDSTSMYIKMLRESNLFSDSFLAAKQTYFRQCNDSLAKTRQNDGPPVGLDYDLLLFTVDPASMFDPTVPVKIVADSLTGNHQRGGILHANDHNLLFTIGRENGQCAIEDIQFQQSR